MFIKVKPDLNSQKFSVARPKNLVSVVESLSNYTTFF